MSRVAAAAVVVAAAALASGAGGRVVRVEEPPRRQVFVPAGTFTMGIDEDAAHELATQCELAYPGEADGPSTMPASGSPICLLYMAEMEHMRARRVFESAFWIDRDEVSVADYHACVAAGACAADALSAGDDRYITADGPMVNVEWDEAQHFCRWHGGMLPTEAQWERAARGDGDGPWPWGTIERPDDFNHGKAQGSASRDLGAMVGATSNNPSTILAQQGDGDDSDGTAILSRPGNYAWGDGPYGTRDQAGNVAEWTADAYLRPTVLGVGSLVENTKAGYDDLGPVNPERTGNLSDSRIVRGGSWRQPAFIARVNARDPYYGLEGYIGTQIYDPRRRLPYVGFRCVRAAPDR